MNPETKDERAEEQKNTGNPNRVNAARFRAGRVVTL
jgi:hypothetical protein